MLLNALIHFKLTCGAPFFFGFCMFQITNSFQQRFNGRFKPDTCENPWGLRCCLINRACWMKNSRCRNFRWKTPSKVDVRCWSEVMDTLIGKIIFTFVFQYVKYVYLCIYMCVFCYTYQMCGSYFGWNYESSIFGKHLFHWFYVMCFSGDCYPFNSVRNNIQRHVVNILMSMICLSDVNLLTGFYSPKGLCGFVCI